MAVFLDVELMLDKVKTILQAELNTRILAINSQKNDGITLKQIDSDAYFLQSLDDGTANFDPYLFYGVDSVESIPIGPAVLKKYTLQVVIVLADDKSDLFVAKKLFRYNRVLEELFNEKWRDVFKGVDVMVEALQPVAFSVVDSSNVYRAIGVDLKVTLG